MYLLRFFLKQTWLLTDTRRHNFFYYLVVNNLNLFKRGAWDKNFFFFKKLNLLNLVPESRIHTTKFKKISKFFNESNQHFESRLVEKLSSRVTVVDRAFFDKTRIDSKIINIFFFLNQPVTAVNTKKTTFFNFFYFKQTRMGSHSTNIKKILLRWMLTSDLFYNLFWHAISPIIFSSPFFKNETLAINWAAHSWEQLLWRYYHLFFNFKFNSNTEKFNFFCCKMQEDEISFFFSNWHLLSF